MEFLKNHIEKLLLLLCLLALGGTVFLGLGSMNASSEGAGDSVGRVQKLEPVSAQLLGETLERISGGKRLWDAGSNVVFTAPERKSCVNVACQALVEPSQMTCPHCGENLEVKDPDSDQDGITDKVESQYGMNPHDASDAHGDLDRDGFSNLAELQEGFDPADTNSHPPLITQLRVRDIEHVETAISLRGVAKGPTLYTLQIAIKYPGQKRPPRASFVKEGSRFGQKMEFKLKSYESIRSKTESGFRNDSFALVTVEGADRKLTEKKPLVVGNSSATLMLLNDQGWEQEVRVDSQFRLDGIDYDVKDVKGESVRIRPTKGGASITLRKPAEEELAPSPGSAAGNSGMPTDFPASIDPSFFLPSPN